MIKILYASGNNLNGKIQLKRFLSAIQGKPYIIKIAAYKISSPINTNIDWTLDALLNVLNPLSNDLDNDNFKIYLNQIKYFKPDLIISDLEYFTSVAARVLNIKLWQCSSSLINFSLTLHQKKKLKLFSRYSSLSFFNEKKYQTIINLCDNSDRNFIYSHLGDIDNINSLPDPFEWVRPYHQIGKKSIPCQHNIIAGLLKNNKNIIKSLKRYSDCVAFTDDCNENYKNIKLKPLVNEAEYFCNLKNSNFLICEGQTSFLADAFYNNKYSVIMPNLYDSECVSNSVYSEYYKLGSLIYDSETDLDQFLDVSLPSYSYNKNIKYLHERIEEL